jgi:hypothetical protein
MTEPVGIDSDNPEGLSGTMLRFQNAMIETVGCVADALDDVCSVGFTIGESYVPFDPDPDDKSCRVKDTMCSQAWIRVMSVQPTGTATLGFDGANCSMSMVAEIEVGVLRCIKTPAKGKAPTETDVLMYAMQAMNDMNSILCAVLSCGPVEGESVWDETPSVGVWRPQGPLGGQYGGTWTFRVELS